jgi:TetR/AcrR family transcriptional regulator, lmrAB and yxaGH operons repressor
MPARSARGDSRRRMIEAAVSLFRSSGYHATGLNRLVAVGGAPKGSLYFHFPGGKEQLAAEAMRAAAGQVRDVLAQVATAAPDAAGAVGAVVDHLGRELAASDFRSGCPLATVALDAAGESPVIAEACAAGYRSWQEALAALFGAHGVPAPRREELATVVLAAIEGGLLLARTGRDLAPLRAVRRHLIDTITTESAH